MAEHPNITLWRSAQEAFSRRDLDAARRFLSENVTYHFAGNSPFAGDHAGLKAVQQFLGRLVSELSVQITEVHSVMADDDHVVALIRGSMARGDEQFTLNQANVYHIVDGKITEAWLLPVDPFALDEFLA